ncbi:O-antigen ligase family protein [Fusobacterium mortiferum]|uniref:O-antigen ligase family protein n=1 Tax=Fusobacterium mortiferum TaxID=850 RepID=UPI00356495EE
MLNVYNFYLNFLIIFSLFSSYRFPEKFIIISNIFYLVIVFIFNIINIFYLKKILINKMIIFILLINIITLFLNLNLKNLYNFGGLILVIWSCYFLICYNSKKFSYYLENNIYVYNIINFILYNFFTTYSGIEKNIYFITLTRKVSPYVSYSNSSTIAALTFCYIFFKIKKKWQDYIMLLMVIIILFNTLKLTSILSIILTIVIYYSYKLKNKKYFIILLLLFFSSFIFIELRIEISKYIDIRNILTGREILWQDYITYINKRDFLNFIFGSGYYSENISFLYHPHNSYLTILYYYGILGCIIYFFWIYKGLINSKKLKEIHIIILWLCIMMVSDDYYITSFLVPLNFLIFWKGYNLKNKEISKKKFRIKGEIKIK